MGIEIFTTTFHRSFSPSKTVAKEKTTKLSSHGLKSFSAYSCIRISLNVSHGS